jgi:hypothetical protein
MVSILKIKRPVKSCKLFILSPVNCYFGKEEEAQMKLMAPENILNVSH